MTLWCDRDHQHCQLEGQMPGFGRARTSDLEDYQPTLAAVLASCLAALNFPLDGILRLLSMRRMPFMGRSPSWWRITKPKQSVQCSVFIEILDIQRRWLLLKCWNPEVPPRPFSTWPDLSWPRRYFAATAAWKPSVACCAVLAPHSSINFFVERWDEWWFIKPLDRSQQAVEICEIKCWCAPEVSSNWCTTRSSDHLHVWRSSGSSARSIQPRRLLDIAHQQESFWRRGDALPHLGLALISFAACGEIKPFSWSSSCSASRGQHRVCGSFLAYDVESQLLLEGHFADLRSFLGTNSHHWCESALRLLPQKCHQPWCGRQAQVEGIGGVLRWISSERQFGDGFTKIAARQLLADRIRHSAIKFTFDPGYTASKKKTAVQRAKSRNEFTTTTSHNQTSPYNNAADDDVPVNVMPPASDGVDENDLVPETNLVRETNAAFENVLFSEDFAAVEYAMMAAYAAVPDETFPRPSRVVRPIFQVPPCSGFAGDFWRLWISAIWFWFWNFWTVRCNWRVCSPRCRQVMVATADFPGRVFGLVFWNQCFGLATRYTTSATAPARSWEQFDGADARQAKTYWQIGCCWRQQRGSSIWIQSARRIAWAWPCSRSTGGSTSSWSTWPRVSGTSCSESVSYHLCALWPLLAFLTRMWSSSELCPVDRSKPTLCLNGHLPPHVQNEHTGTRLAEDCKEFFAADGPRESYINTIMYEEPDMWLLNFIFSTLFIPCRLHSMQRMFAVTCRGIHVSSISLVIWP